MKSSCFGKLPWQWLALVVWVVPTIPAIAGDRAMIDFIGYSQDQRYLAVEEYGVSDGVGLAYSSIFVVDLTTGEFAAGSPFRAEADEDAQQPLAEIRARSAAASKEALAGRMVEMPVDIIALSGDGVLGPASEFHFGMPSYGLVPAVTQGDYTLTLEAFDQSRTEGCSGLAWRQGFALRLAGDGPTREVYRDGTGDLPAWRGCPIGYRLYAVVTPHESGLSSATAAIIATYPMDFEGPSRRFMVVPIISQ